MNKITVGEQTSIGDKAVVHVAKLKGDAPTNIGSRVTIGAVLFVYIVSLVLDHHREILSSPITAARPTDNHPPANSNTDRPTHPPIHQARAP